MSEWGKPKHTTFPTSPWWNSGWGKLDHFKVPGSPPLLKSQNPSSLEVSTCPNKNYCSSKLCTQFYTLPSDILRTIDPRNFSLVHHKKIKNHWRYSHRIIYFIFPLVIINSSTSRSTTLCITKTSVICV